MEGRNFSVFLCVYVCVCMQTHVSEYLEPNHLKNLNHVKSFKESINKTKCADFSTLNFSVSKNWDFFSFSSTIFKEN